MTLSFIRCTVRNTQCAKLIAIDYWGNRFSIKEANSCHVRTNRLYSILLKKKISRQNLPLCLPEKNTIRIIQKDFFRFLFDGFWLAPTSIDHLQYLLTSGQYWECLLHCFFWVHTYPGGPGNRVFFLFLRNLLIIFVLPYYICTEINLGTSITVINDKIRHFTKLYFYLHDARAGRCGKVSFSVFFQFLIDVHCEC